MRVKNSLIGAVLVITKGWVRIVAIRFLLGTWRLVSLIFNHFSVFDVPDSERQTY